MSDKTTASDASREIARLRANYLDLMTESLVGRLNRDPALQEHLGGYDEQHRTNGWDWPSGAPSMIGWKRMNHLRRECERVIAQGVPGDFLEAGVWRGGASMIMAAVLKAYDVRDRRVFAADTFAGLPDDTEPSDAAAVLKDVSAFAVALPDVRDAFARYGLLDGRIVFLEGRFEQTLAAAPISKLAVLRLDGDTFASAHDTLEAVYDKVSPGGSVILDDYYLFEGNRKAIDDFRDRMAIADPIVRIDDYAGYWVRRRSRP